MDATRFETELRAEGFQEVLTKGLAAGTHNEDHHHDYDVKALVLEGQITLTVGSGARTYRTGEIFTMASGRRHVEDIGAEGVRYIAGRRHP